MRLRRLAHPSLTVAAVVAAAALATSCFIDSTQPGAPLFGHFTIVPLFQTTIPGLVDLAEARFTLTRTSDSTVLDTTVAIVPGDTAVDLSLTVVMLSSQETFLMTVALVTPQGDTAYFGGPVEVAPSTTTGAPTTFEVEFGYVGVGADAVSVNILTRDTSLFTGDSVTFTAEAVDTNGDAIAGTPIGWFSPNPTVAQIPDSSNGTVVAGGRGTAQVIAVTPTELADTGTVVVQPVPSAIVVVDGDGQVALASMPLPDSIVIEVRGDDGLGISGVDVSFTPGAGTATPGAGVTDANGQASFRWTLGAASGVQTVSVTLPAFAGVQGAVTATVASGTDAIWLGVVSSDWFDGGNWNTGRVPGDTTDVFIPSGTPNSPTACALTESASALCYRRSAWPDPIRRVFVNWASTPSQSGAASEIPISMQHIRPSTARSWIAGFGRQRPGIIGGSWTNRRLTAFPILRFLNVLVYGDAAC